jgi:hypothetical protein
MSKKGAMTPQVQGRSSPTISRIFPSVSVPRSCTRDEGRSLEVGLQELASNHLKLRR